MNREYVLAQIEDALQLSVKLHRYLEENSQKRAQETIPNLLQYMKEKLPELNGVKKEPNAPTTESMN